MKIIEMNEAGGTPALPANQIALCVIAGNESAVMERFIRSFRPAIDFLCVCFSRGNLLPDGTEEIVELVCEELGLPLLVERWENAPANDWPHVDDFGAARTRAFELGRDTGAGWLMWADCDDQLPDPKMVKKLAGEVRDFDMVMGPYVLDAGGGHEWRERLIRRDIFLGWENRVHEAIRLRDGARITRAPDLQVFHTPLHSKRGGSRRNLTILESIPEGERTGLEWSYIFSEHFNRREIREAADAGAYAVLAEDLGDDRRYDVYVRLAQCFASREGCERPLLEALRLRPGRREAVVALARRGLEDGRDGEALAWLKIAESIPAPDPAPSGHDPACYGWKIGDLKDTALSLAGQSDRVLERRKFRFRKHGEKISVLHPTCRPGKARKIRELWLSRAAHPEQIEYIFGINAGDIEPGDLIYHYRHALSEPVSEGFSTAVVNHNAAAAAASGQLMIVAQDDIYPPQAWDVLIWRMMEGHLKKPRVLHVHDGFRDDHVMVVQCVTRPWLRENGGLLLAPEYDGWFSDTEFSDRCYAAGQVIDGRMIEFYHDHPAFTGAATDEGYQRQQNPEAFARGKAIYEKRKAERLKG